MRILHINAVSGIRSTGKICSEISDYLNTNGHEGYIAYSDGIPYSNCYKIGSFAEKKIHALLSRMSGKQAYFSKNGTKKLLNFIDNLKPHVVHLHNLHANYINFGILLNFLAKKNIPTVLTLHDCWFFTGKCTHYTIDGCFRWQSGCSKCPRLKKDNPSWFFDRTAEMFEDKKKWFTSIPRLAVVGVSDWITNEARKSFLSSARIITRIYNWIDQDVFKLVVTSDLRRKHWLEDKFVILGVASGWNNTNGLDRFLNLASAVNSDIKIILVGRMNNKAQLPENIINIDEIHNTKELSAYYSLADVYVHLKLEDTFGKTIAEAMACGTPVVVFNSTACPEIVGEGCGYVVEKGDIKGVYDAVKKIISEGKEKYSENCIRHVTENFNYHKQVQKYIEVYNQLMR